MPSIIHTTSNADKICRICSSYISRGATSVTIKDIHVSPKIVDLHFHPECFTKELKNLYPQEPRKEGE